MMPDVVMLILFLICGALVVMVMLAIMELILLAKHLRYSEEVLQLAKGWFSITREKHEETQKVVTTLTDQIASKGPSPEAISAVSEKTAVRVVELIKEEKANESSLGLKVPIIQRERG